MATITEEPIFSEDTLSKLAIVKQKKDTADQAFKASQWKDALRSYHECLLYLHGIDKNAQNAMTTSRPVDSATPPEKPKTEIDEILEKVYSNMSACHVKTENWRRALETATKALDKNPENYKAAFRKGKAQGELGYFEKAEKTLTDLLAKNPADAPIIKKELAELAAKDREREKAHNAKFRGFLSRDKPTTKAEEEKLVPVEVTVPASIEEVVDA